MPKPYVKSISDESMVVRRTLTLKLLLQTLYQSLYLRMNSSKQLRTLHTHSQLWVNTSSAYPVGAQIPIDTVNTGAIGYTTFTSADRTTIQITNLDVTGDAGAITAVKVTASVSKNVTAKKTKSPYNMFVLKVNQTVQNLDKQNYGLTYSGVYGTRIEDVDLSLGITDVFNIHAVYESMDDADPILPSITLVEPTFFETKSIVTGKTSGARARVVDFNSAI
ncbi:MAG: hypothetical protein CM15mV10_0280 [uncultured marine virus]|nr:MAG: hypothetical protein CM15mV10_0280 [uncultured marine virus]